LQGRQEQAAAGGEDNTGFGGEGRFKASSGDKGGEICGDEIGDHKTNAPDIQAAGIAISGKVRAVQRTNNNQH